MKIALVSDTHGQCKGLADSIRQQKAEYILHMGDGVAEAYQLKKDTGLPTFVVAGNNDFGTKEKADLFFVLEGIPIWMTHGHRHGVHYGREQLMEAALQKEAAIALYGHTHIFRDETIGGVRMINPGSPTLPRDGEASYAILDLPAGTLERIIVEKPKLFHWF